MDEFYNKYLNENKGYILLTLGVEPEEIRKIIVKKVFSKVPISCLIMIYLNPLTTPYK